MYIHTGVPGLWEVELSSASDVDAVITHVQRISSEADHSSGSSHSVVQLSISSEKTRQSNANANANTSKGKSSIGIRNSIEVGLNWDQY